jgi:hypothetical protein
MNPGTELCALERSSPMLCGGPDKMMLDRHLGDDCLFRRLPSYKVNQ